MGEIRRRYDCRTGLSDHSGAIYASLAAATLGANFLEVHVCFSRECFGPDVPASITTQELSHLVNGVRTIETALANPVNKDGAAEDLAGLRQVFGKSIVAARSLPGGSVVAENDVALKKPGTGLQANRLAFVLGKRLKSAVKENGLILEQNLE